jgi:hypothetical protein
VDELHGIADHGRYFPGIDGTTFPETPIDHFFWSSSSDAAAAPVAWVVSFSFGRVDSRDKTTGASYIRCVRTGP